MIQYIVVDPATLPGIVVGIAFAWGATLYNFGTSARPGPGYFPFGLGILLDTFVVRTITVPAIATLVGRASWWPAPAGRRVRREKRVSTAL